MVADKEDLMGRQGDCSDKGGIDGGIGLGGSDCAAPYSCIEGGVKGIKRWLDVGGYDVGADGKPVTARFQGGESWSGVGKWFNAGGFFGETIADVARGRFG